MPWPLVVLGAVVVVLGLYTWWTARRLDRLHARLDAAARALDAQLLIRAQGAIEVAGLLTPYDDELAAAAHVASVAAGRLDAERQLDESAVSRMLMEAERRHPDFFRSEKAVDIHDATTRSGFARRFHNDAVRDVLVVRERRVVRWGRLAGHAPLPSYVEIDDAVLPDPRVSVPGAVE